jgi:hypothetical protein
MRGVNNNMASNFEETIVGETARQKSAMPRSATHNNLLLRGPTDESRSSSLPDNISRKKTSAKFIRDDAATYLVGGSGQSIQLL